MTASVPLLRVVCGDITQIRAEVVVNAANRAMRGGGGVDGAIHRVGGPAILEDCIRRFPDGLPTGGVGWTAAGELPARYVVHAVGPNHGAGEDDPALLRSCYSGAIRTATDLGARSMAVPLISAGVYRWPLDEAISIALETILETPGDLDVITLVVFDDTVEARVRDLLGAGLAAHWVPYRILDAVVHLHEAGYRQLRCTPYVYATGHWRAEITVAGARAAADPVARYSSAAGQDYLDMRVEPWTSPVEVAAEVLRHLDRGLVPDRDPRHDAYVRWFGGLRSLAARRRAYPVAFREYDELPGWSVGDGPRYPDPPAD
ncbi:macro domain-containing protein [Tsukamurella pulmonis]|uniref:macro domain-containing protein n=1 Tax=Tsukamurella pulmonis TaxID=47312 RepID=UPI000838EB35|nr:macro domain-containing protein [Tsukamurella pulmonis]